MKRILMATDLSARSDRALERAIDLAREHDAELTVIHVVDEDLPVSLADAHQATATRTITAHVDRLAADNRPRIATEVRLGRPYVDILEASDQAEAELIVLGMHRKDTLKDMFRGTTVERVIRGSRVPVLLAKDRICGPYRRIMVGVDFSIHSRRAVALAIDLVADGELHLVHAYDVPFKGFLYGHDTRRQTRQEHHERFEEMVDEEMASLLAHLDTGTPRIHRILQEGSAQEVVHRQVDRVDPDLLVIGTHGRTGVAHAFFGSFAEDLLRNPPCDVLAAKAW